LGIELRFEVKVNSALHPFGVANRVPALAGVRAGMPPLPGGM